MMLGHNTLESPIVFDEMGVNYLVVENRKQMTQYVYELAGGIENQEGGFTLSDNNEIMDMSRSAELILNPFALDPNSTATINCLLQKMKFDALSDYQLRTDEMISMINSTIGKIVSEQHHSVGFSENLDIIKLFKFLGVRFDDVCESLLENICEYMLVMRDYSNTKLFIFINLRSFLDEDELQELYRFAMYNKLSILLMESNVFERSSCEKVRLIDKDLCEIGENTHNY